MAISKNKFVGVIGLGNMGGGIARNLVNAGHNVLVWDIDEKAVINFSQGATFSEPRDMAKRCTIIFFAVPVQPK